MHRDPTRLHDAEFDVLVIGAGAFGAAAARDCALRGLKTALIERADFGASTSSACFKMVHGGIRYLQHADFPRVRESCHERSVLLRIAPHLVAPLPIAIPTYGHGRSSRWMLGTGASVYDLLTLERNRHIADPRRCISNSRWLGRSDLLELFPHLRAPSLTGAVVFEDGQMYSPARVVLAFVQSAVAAGAVAVNYIQATEFTWQGDRITGVRAQDALSGEQYEIRAKLTLNAAGPWADYLCTNPRFPTHRRRPFSRDAYFVVDRRPEHGYGVAVQGLSRDRDAKFGRGTRHLFAAPWRDKTLLGVWHRHFTEHPLQVGIEPSELDAWIAELNAVYPALELRRSEVTFADCGLVPFGDVATASELSFGKDSRIIDHRATDGVHGLVTLIGIRFTTARSDAARALDLLLAQRPSRPAAADTARLPLRGGDIADFDAFVREARSAWPAHIGTDSLTALLRNHGSAHGELLRIVKAEPDGAQRIAGTPTLAAEVSHAVDNEMAMRLEDVVLRRTDLASGSHPGREALVAVAHLMAARLGWSAEHALQEIAAAERALAWHLAQPRKGPTADAPKESASLSQHRMSPRSLIHSA